MFIRPDTQSRAKQHAISKYWVWLEGGLITQKSNPMGITQGRTLLFSLNLSFVARSHGQYRDLGYVSRR